MKIALCFSFLIFSACSRDAGQSAKRDAEKVRIDVKQGFEKAKNSPATKELESDVKSGFHKADAAVTKGLEKGRDKIREGARDLKHKAEQP